MKVICIGETGKDVSEKRILKTGAFRTSKYSVELDKEYEVFGALVDQEGLAKYLIIEEGAWAPRFIPSELFRITDSSLRSDWHLTIDLNAYVPTKIGYKRLVSELSHFEGIIELEQEHLVYFFELKERWKKEDLEAAELKEYS